MGSEEAIDGAVWRALCSLVNAASNLDGQALAGRSQEFSNKIKLAGQQQAGLYIWFLLRQVAACIVGRVPNADDLKIISAENYRAFSTVVTASRSAFEDTLRKVFELQPLEKEIGPGDLLVLGSAALGVLLRALGSDLDTLKPKLGEWWLRHSAKFYNQGLKRSV
jgi:hypothetical protein